MHDQYSKIYIKIGDKEVTIEGGENFVFQQFQQIFGKEKPVKEKKSNASNKTHSVKQSSSQLAPSLETTNYKKFLNQLGTDFKNWLAGLSEYVSSRDKILAAAYYNQLMRNNQKFYVKDINNLFKKYEIKISRVSNFIYTFEIQKLIYKIDKSKKAYKFTNEGIEYVNNLYASKVRTIKVVD